MPRVYIFGSLTILWFVLLAFVELVKADEVLTPMAVFEFFLETGLLLIAILTTTLFSIELRDLRLDHIAMRSDFAKAKADGETWRQEAVPCGIMRRSVCLLLALGALIGAPGNPAAVASSPARDALLNLDSPAWQVAAPDLFRVRFDTSKGAFLLEVNRRWAPRGADRIYNLVRLGFYDDTRFYRVREGFIVQFGLSGDPAVNAIWYERTGTLRVVHHRVGKLNE